MNILNFQMPEKVIMNKETQTKGFFEFRPLEPGFGLTVGNAIRRVLLSSLKGYAITHIKIEGVDHEFSTIPGVVEDVTEIVLNLKQIRFRSKGDIKEPEVIKINISKKEQFLAGDLAQSLIQYEVVNPELLIAQLEKTTSLKMEITIDKGRGCVLAEENKKETQKIGEIPIDSIFTPIKNVSYKIEDYRLGQKTDFEKLIVEITTDGTIEPRKALTEATHILIKHFLLFSDENITIETEETNVVEEYDEDTAYIRQNLKSRLSDLNLSVRALNCLQSAEIETMADLVVFTKNDLMKFRNFGRKSLVELEELLVQKGMTFGMDISKYKL